jgi:hypothetical protein
MGLLIVRRFWEQNQYRWIFEAGCFWNQAMRILEFWCLVTDCKIWINEFEHKNSLSAHHYEPTSKEVWTKSGNTCIRSSKFS